MSSFSPVLLESTVKEGLWAATSGLSSCFTMTGGLLSACNDGQCLWIFGYGSLTWKVNFPYRRKVIGYIKGYARRFYQGSCDHRGIPGKPGRVATLLDDKEGVVWGVAYEVEPTEIENVLMYLDIREKDGYKLTYTTLHAIDHSAATVKVMLYIATPNNNFYLGPAPLPDIAKQIAHSEGPSGKNSEYLLKLAAFMHDIRKQHEHCKDEHLFELEVLVKNDLESLGNANI